MRKVKFLSFAALFTVTLAACSLFPDVNKKKPVDGLDTPLAENSFYAQNMETEKYYKVKAEMLYEGDKCVIWAEESAKVKQQTARNIANIYDTIIRPRVVETFSKKDFYIDEETNRFDDMLDYANWLAGRDDGKITVLLLDIKDGYKKGSNDSYVAGYFFGGNFYPKGKINGSKHYSNGRDMIYVDTYPGLQLRLEQTYATFAHELQHLINHVTALQMDRYVMDTWVDEGLSSQAEYLYLEKNPSEKCEWFINDRNGTIAKGNNFFVWDNHREKPMSVLDDYATVYLFFRWLYLQADAELQPHLFYDIENSTAYNYRTVTNTAQQINSAWGNWETLLRTWLAANYYPQNSYGYTGDDYLKTTIRVKPIAEQTIPLYPGEGVYSIINNSFTPPETVNNIRYAGLAKDETAIDTSSPYTGDVLLTFNANTSNTAAHETGYLTGFTPATPRMAAENMHAGNLTSPYILDARDMLRRNKE
ncbi:MAG: hypothetical protein LBH20_03365 [Treponema sp.]|jgi:hypothetical protein|nr:hypothetical protein [Treponema sp.]